MPNQLNLSDVSSPLAQTFSVTEPGGVYLTGIGLYFFSKPTDDDGNFPVTLELRPMTEAGTPNSFEVYPGTRVVKSKADVIVNTDFDSLSETKFDFPAPFYIPENTQVAMTLSTNAPPGGYRVWISELGDFEYGSTSKRVIQQPNVGVFFVSSNGTNFNAEQNKDLAFKVYNAQFKQSENLAVLYNDAPPLKRLSKISPQMDDPLFFTGADSAVVVQSPQHGFQALDYVRIYGLDSAETYNGVKGTSILGKRQITNVDPYGFTVKMDSAADSSIRGGGSDILTTQQHVVDQFKLAIPEFRPQDTTLAVQASMVTTRSWAQRQNHYVREGLFTLRNGSYYNPELPYIIASADVESDMFGSNSSCTFNVEMNSTNINVAPYIDLNSAVFEVGNNIIDYPDSAGAFLGADGYDSFGYDGRNYLSSFDYQSEAVILGGTHAAKFIAVPTVLYTPATTIKVIVDAINSSYTDFEVWYRTGVTGRNDDYLQTNRWIKFSTSSIPPNSSNYDDMPRDNDRATYREYAFNQSDLPEFNVYQIKIVMKSTNSTYVPQFRNLRTIATV